jgi:hypothetical protein
MFITTIISRRRSIPKVYIQFDFNRKGALDAVAEVAISNRRKF